MLTHPLMFVPLILERQLGTGEDMIFAAAATIALWGHWAVAITALSLGLVSNQIATDPMARLLRQEAQEAEDDAGGRSTP